MPRITPAARAPAQLAANCGSWKPVPSEIRMKANALPAALTLAQSIVPLWYDTSTPLVVVPAAHTRDSAPNSVVGALSTSEPRPAPALESPAGSPPTAHADSRVANTSTRMGCLRAELPRGQQATCPTARTGVARQGEHRARAGARIAQRRSQPANAVHASLRRRGRPTSPIEVAT